MDLTLDDPLVVEEWEVGPEFGKLKNYQLPQANSESQSSEMIIVESSSDHGVDSAQFRHNQPVQRKVLTINPHVSDNQSAKSYRVKQEFSSYVEASGNPDDVFLSMEERQKQMKNTDNCLSSLSNSMKNSKLELVKPLRVRAMTAHLKATTVVHL